jgi:adenosine/AMP kinase
MELITVKVDNPDAVNVVIGQSHFIKTIEDIHEALMGTVPGIKFGVAFNEASGPRLVRHSGTDDALVELAKANAMKIGAGHLFVLFMQDAFPINVMKALKDVPEICNIYCATANPVELILAETTQGRGVMGVVDGLPPLGDEGPEDILERKSFLRKIGYKL